MITSAQIATACACPLPRAENWAPSLNAAMGVFSINNDARIAAFLAQIAHESGRLAYTREIWGPTDAQTGYEGRKDLGNLQTGDGYRYRGRGLIMTTGRANYCATRDGLYAFLSDVPDFEDTPEALEAPKWAAYSAGWFWSIRRLNDLADAGAFQQITRRINGGTNGMQDRLSLWESAKLALA